MIALAGCQQPDVQTTYDSRETGGEIDGVNEGYVAGSIAMHKLALPSIKDMRDMHYVSDKDSKKEREEQQRLPVIQRAGLTYGMQTGLAYGTQAIDAELNRQAARLNSFDFQSLMLPGPDGKMILPPVISEMDDTFESQDSGQSIRIADKSYTIIQEASLASNTPLWQAYLFRSYDKPMDPANNELPRNQRESEVWAASVAKGFDQGVKQSLQILREDKARLVRDFDGMVLYKQLIDEGKVSAPVIAEVNMGLTGTGKIARYNDRRISITANSSLNVDNPDKITSRAGQSPIDGSTTQQDQSIAPDDVPDPDSGSGSPGSGQAPAPQDDGN